MAGLVADAAAPDDAARTIAKAVDAWGRLDVLVNNAGAGAILPLAAATADRIMKNLAVNVVGPSLLTAAALLFLAAGKGDIIYIPTTFDHQCLAAVSQYHTHKAPMSNQSRSCEAGS